MNLTYTVDADTNGMLELSRDVDREGKKVISSMKKMDKEVDKFGNELDDAGRAMGRFIDKSGRMREKNGQFVKGMQQSNNGLSKLSSAMNALKGGGAVAGALGAATAATVAFVTSQTSAIKEMSILSNRANLSIDTFQAWSVAAKSMNVDADQLSQTMQDTADRVGEFVKSGGKEGELVDVYEQYLKPMNIGLNELKSLKPDEVLQLVYKGMKETGSSSSEMIAAFEQISSNSSYLIPLLDGTGQKINNIKDAMQRDGKLVTDDDVTKATVLDGKVKVLASSFDSLKTNIALGLIDPVTLAIDKTNDLILALKEGFNLAKKAGDFLSTDAQKANIKKIKDRESALSTEAIPSTNTGNVANTFASFGYAPQANLKKGKTEREIKDQAKAKVASVKAIETASKALLEIDKQINAQELERFNLQQHQINRATAANPLLNEQARFKKELDALKLSEQMKLTTKQEYMALEAGLIATHEENKRDIMEETFRGMNAQNEMLMSTFDSLQNAATNVFSGMLSGTMSATDAMKSFGNAILNEAIGSLVQMGIEQAKQAVMGKALQAANTAATVTEAAVIAAAWQPAAMAASIATSGGAATAGSAAYTASMAATAIPIAGGRLYGGPTQAGKAYRVSENGKPEMWSNGAGQQFMMGGGRGHVTPARDIGGGSVTINQSFVFDGSTPQDQQTMQRFAQMSKTQTMQIIQQEMRQGGMLAR